MSKSIAFTITYVSRNIVFTAKYVSKSIVFDSYIQWAQKLLQSNGFQACSGSDASGHENSA